ncbi:MAG: hypothetical protein U1F26_07020 [Lysobacterales bacterium]
MKLLCLLGLSIAATSAPGVSASGLQELRANYEVKITSGGATHSIRTGEALGEDGLISQDLGPYSVALKPELDGHNGFLLELTVVRKATRAGGISPIASRSYQGSLGGKLEFTGDFGELRVDGAIVLYERRS